MRNLFIIIVMILTFVACRKQNEVTELSDKIIYTDLMPDSIISSIDTVFYLGYDDSGGVFKCDSLNSTGLYEVDINKDNIPDLHFKHEFWEDEPFYYSPHYWGNYYENIKIDVTGINGAKIGGMNENDFSKYDSWVTPSNVIGNYNISKNIADTNMWIDSGIIYISSDSWLSYFESESQYIAVQIKTNNQELYGWIQIKLINKKLNLPLEDADGMAINTSGSDWIKDLEVLGWAINQTNNNCIRTGQIE